MVDLDSYIQHLIRPGEIESGMLQNLLWEFFCLFDFPEKVLHSDLSLKGLEAGLSLTFLSFTPEQTAHSPVLMKYKFCLPKAPPPTSLLLLKV